MKIINDPVYGFLRFPEQELMQIIDHPWFQRLRNIKQMGSAHLVYPGAVHSRFHHSLGACHLMGKALDELKAKGIELSKEECTAARTAILLHDIGHGPFSHALEHSLIEGVSHEYLSNFIIRSMNQQFGGSLEGVIDIYRPTYTKKYLRQLVSSQLDVDRMDYLNRDSFYTGVSEGVIGYDRILQMLTVQNEDLMVEEKGVHSVEKFIIARRLMYWQVYLHKTVLGSEQLLIKILQRAKELAQMGEQLFATPSLYYFLYNNITAKNVAENGNHIEMFCKLDDSDVFASIKVWQTHKDKILSLLCKMLIERNLYKVILSASSLEEMMEQKKKSLTSLLQLDSKEIQYFIFTGKTSNSTYDINDEHIQIAMKDGSVRDISEIEDPLVNQALARPVHKNYICYFQP
ncbi:MAG: HD domain-containing protein [Bacteroidota bacterium]